MLSNLSGWHALIILGMTLLPLILALVALVQVWRTSAPTNTQLLWTILIVVAPIVGAIIWWIVGRRTSTGLVDGAP